MPPPDAKDLLEKYHKGEISESERALVETWYLQYKPEPANVDFKQLEKDQAKSLNDLLTEISPAPVRRLWPRIAAVASVVIAGAALFITHATHPKVKQVAAVKSNTHEIAPGSNKAILTLANGEKIFLSQTQNGKIANQGNILIKKTGSGQIVYSSLKNGVQLLANLYNIATTPRGGQYTFTLADGTKVWLNAASSIKFPVAFDGNERRVELSGEAYFEVAHNAAKPFRVVTGKQVVEVLGTHFDINAYADEADVRTTLLEGSVKVSSAGKTNILKPGQQSQLKDGAIDITDVDTEEAIAWKNGLFYFKDADIKTVMRQMARWYDADISYEDNLPERQFSGEISKNINASQLLDILSFKKIHFKIEGKKIIIMH